MICCIVALEETKLNIQLTEFKGNALKETLGIIFIYLGVISKCSDLEIKSCYFHKFSLGSILLYSMKLNKIKVYFF